MKKSLTRRERLRNSGDIKSLFKSGKRIEAQGIKLLYRTNGSEVNKMAVVVSRGCGGAVRRNREKRITREAYRSMKPRLKTGNDLMFIIGRFEQGFTQRRETLHALLLRAGFFGTAR
jgi:ribonuclease P protein component